MSILEKSEKIGIELRNTVEGTKTFNLYKQIKSASQELAVEFFKLVNRHYTRIHFFAIPQAIDIFKENTNNPHIGELVKSILAIENLEAFGEANIPLGQFTDRLSKSAFSNTVKFQLPEDIHFTPELVRLSNSLTVECLRTNILQQFINEYQTNPDLPKAVSRLDELRCNKAVAPYSKEDRKCLAILRKEYRGICSVDAMHSLMSMLAYINIMIFDAFYGNVFEISEQDVISYRRKELKQCSYIKAVLNPDVIPATLSSGWIMKICKADGSTSYAQMFNKEIKFAQGEASVTITALAHDIL